MIIFVLSCRGIVPATKKSDSIPVTRNFIPRMGYAIQVGAFSVLDNAVHLTETLQKKGLDAYYFIHDSGLYKVRFGNFSSRSLAMAEAQDLCKNRVIEEFYIVGPEQYPDTTSLRRGIVQAAKSFIGVPYRFGSASSEEGFDCSGLAMAVYRLNGFDLPRTSRQQWAAGRPLEGRDPAEADLVFFDTSGTGGVSHVGVYLGKGQFVHAPKRGKKIRIDAMSDNYYKQRYMGARTYL